MAKKGNHWFNSRAGLLGSAGTAGIVAFWSCSGAFAQGAASPPADADHDEVVLEEIMVTATRIQRNGYDAPTPTSVIGIEEIAAKAPANIADFVNELPALSGSTSPKANVGSLSAGLIGINALNLRNIGANRTLILLDGQRVAASTLTGLVDINTLPQALVKRVDIVTGGASAGWGSDAVSGVVNFVLDKDFTGIKGTVQGGVTTYGDDRNFNASLSAGTRFAEDRGHVMISGEVAHNDGIKGIGDRKWFNSAKLFINPAYTATNGQPQLLNLPGAGFATATPGGIITSGPLRGTYFGPGGTPAQFNYGSIVSGNFMVGGDYQYADFAKSGDLDPRLNRQSVFGRISYDLTDHVTIYGQTSYNRATSRVASLTQFNFGNITIQPDNAFIPASIASRVTAPFSLGTFNQDLGPAIATTRRSSQRYVLGIQGDVAALGSDWKWDVYGQKSINNVYTDGLLTITSRYNQAIDAVRNPSTGAIVCRSTLTNPTNGCVPYNIFGTGVASDAARNYVLGTSWGRSKLTQEVFAGTLRGEPFSNWAGPVSLATGIEHRSEAVSGSNDPLSTTRSYFAGNFLASSGSYHVTEGFLETVVPLANELPFLESLDFNGAIRATDYSTSGYVTTWKAGLTWSPVSDISFRATRSRDIRAPNLAELFQSGQSSTTSFVDPFRANASTTAFQVTSGSTALKPEKADSLGLGVVLKPSFLPDFAASVDYYDIKIQDAIQTVTAAALVNQCFLGNTQFCSQITRNTAGVITSVNVLPVNVARQKARGLDFEASYHRPAFGGDLKLRVLATRFLENTTDDGITPPIDTAGTNGTNGTARNTLPNWRYLASVGYDYDPVSVSVTARGFSAGVYNTTYIECTSACPASTAANMTINNNRLPSALYFDANVTVSIQRDIDLFLAVDNVANKDPAQMAYGPSVGSAPLSVNPLLYDVLGRSFRAGLRFRL
ncbi:TonB-dependent receptor plug domain-containing protein [Niveispirillum sp. KHB5.9]|uniref:TonB-dependent receptor plug domain-containing protein n=1 Tax=Niveispirillum sp. KHB5.9 TaxID=3400269 RepID=UPI003A8C75A9